MIRQKLSIEIDWELGNKDPDLFKKMQEAILNETIKSFTNIYQAKITTGGRVLLTVFHPTEAMKTNFEKLKKQRKKLVAMKKKTIEHGEMDKDGKWKITRKSLT